MTYSLESPSAVSCRYFFHPDIIMFSELVHVSVNTTPRVLIVKSVNPFTTINHGLLLPLKMLMNARNASVMVKLMPVSMMKNLAMVDVLIVATIQVVQCVNNVHQIIIVTSLLVNAFHVPVTPKDLQLLSVGFSFFFIFLKIFVDTFNKIRII